MSRVRALILVTFGILPWAASVHGAEIYKCIDAGGRPLYTSDKKDTAGKKCELVSREVNVIPGQKGVARAGSPPNFPKESPAERASAKGRQREILEQELQTEQQLLAKAKKELATQEATRGGDERNYARVIERLQPYKDTVEVHEKNVEALRRELSNAR